MLDITIIKITTTSVKRDVGLSPKACSTFSIRILLLSTNKEIATTELAKNIGVPSLICENFRHKILIHHDKQRRMLVNLSDSFPEG